MSKELSNPLIDIVGRALKSKPSGTAAKMQERFVNAGQDVIALCDVSGSMDDFVGSTRKSKRDHLVAALKDVLQGFPKLVIVAFSSRARQARIQEMEADLAGQPVFCMLGGGTDMGGAIEYVAQHWKPRKTLLITDGVADDEDYALAAVEMLTGAIDTIYCGPDNDPSVSFLRKLSRAGVGLHVTWDGASELAPTLRRLALPEPKKGIAL